MHERSAARHEAAAALWEIRGATDWAEFERRLAALELQLAQLDADRTKLRQLRASALGEDDGAEAERLSTAIKRRAAKLKADDEKLERERDLLHASRGRVRREQASSVDARTREAAERLAATLNVAAETLCETARLADEHAVRQAGRSERIAADERRSAARARDAADRARKQAEEWINVAKGKRRTR